MGIGKGKHPNSLKHLKPIKKGEIRNPEGARAQDPVKKALKRLTQEFFKECIEAALVGNLAALERIVQDPDSPAIKVGIAKSLHNSIANGDWRTIESIVERIVGKIPVNIDHTSGGERLSPSTVVVLPAKDGSS